MPDQPRTGVEAVDAIEAVFVAFRCFIGGNDHPLLNVPTNALRLAHAEEELTVLRTRLEEAEARERWIPVSERKPAPETDGTRYDVTLRSGCGDLVVDRAYANQGVWHENWSGRELRGVLAWRELPEPYTPSKEQDHE